MNYTYEWGKDYKWRVDDNGITVNNSHYNYEDITEFEVEPDPLKAWKIIKFTTSSSEVFTLRYPYREEKVLEKVEEVIRFLNSKIKRRYTCLNTRMLAELEKSAYCPECGAKMLYVDDKYYSKASEIWNKLRDPSSKRKYGREAIIEELPQRPKYIGHEIYSDLDALRRDEERLVRSYRVTPDEFGSNTIHGYLGLPVNLTIKMDYDQKKCVYAYVETFESVDDSIVAKVGMKGVCPKCNKSVEFQDVHVLFEKGAKTKIKEIKSNLNMPEKHVANVTDVDVKSYLENLVAIAENTLLLEDRLKILFAERGRPETYEFAVKGVWEENEGAPLAKREKWLRERIEQKKIALEDESGVELTEEDISVIAKNNGIELPIKMSKPERPLLINLDTEKLVEPKEPILKKPGLFNKARIEAENENLIRNYEERKKAYLEESEKQRSNIEKSLKYKEECDKYEESLKIYDMALAEASATLKPLIEEEKRNKTILRRKEIESDIDKLEDELKQNAEMQTAGDYSKYESIVWETGHSYAEIKNKTAFIDSEIEETSKLLKEQYECLQLMLSPEIIFPKYDNIVAWSTMYEYFVTGRVSGLTGPDGAYNLYENELRSNIIISQLDEIISKLDAIKNNQFVLYKALSRIDASIKEMSDGIKNVSNQLKGTNQMLAEISNTAAAIEYNTKKTAVYSEITAKTNVALTFMEAIWG